MPRKRYRDMTTPELVDYALHGAYTFPHKANILVYALAKRLAEEHHRADFHWAIRLAAEHDAGEYRRARVMNGKPRIYWSRTKQIWAVDRNGAASRPWLAAMARAQSLNSRKGQTP